MVIRCLLIMVLLPATLASATDVPAKHSIDSILSEIESLEGENDPKCYATASRLEDFMFGTPLTAMARNSKNNHQKALVTRIWQSASATARAAGEQEIGPLHAGKAITQILAFREQADGHWTVQFNDGRQIRTTVPASKLSIRVFAQCC